jgi:hypothetical protein
VKKKKEIDQKKSLSEFSSGSQSEVLKETHNCKLLKHILLVFYMPRIVSENKKAPYQ